MCGISILYNKHKIQPSEYSDFIDSLKIINHRGPDDGGVVLINTTTGDYKIYHSQIESIDLPINDDVQNFNLAFGHKRLSIIDLSPAGHQPMRGKDGSWIVFNGEIYNYIELRAELKSLGAIFKTNSDTEVILEAYRIWGKDCLSKFNGMWAFCLWDAQTKKIFITNDRFGVKPFYYIEKADGFKLFSETKQLKAYSSNEIRINHKHLNNFLNFGYVDTDEETMYENVYRFKNAHYCYVDLNSYFKTAIYSHQKIYYSISQKKVKIDEPQAIEQFRYLLHDAVRIRMRADVDFGFALSGGVDSSAILYAARNVLQQDKSNSELLGFSAIFPGHKDSDESEFVRIVAEDLPCKTVYTEAMNDFSFGMFETHVYHQDEPLGGTSYIAQWSVYEKAHKSGIKILFNGQGADEVFAGYHHHFYRYCRQLLTSGHFGEYFTLVNQYSELKELDAKQIHRTVIDEVKLGLRIKLGLVKFDHHLLKYWSKVGTLDEIMLKDFDTYQIPTYLRVDDRSSMAFSMESRHPFMDYRLIDFGYSLPNNLLIKDGWQKYIIRKSMYEMPKTIGYRKDKKGFTTPQQIWLEKYKSQFEEYLDYNEKVLGVKSPSHDTYQNYFLGAWFKTNGL